MNPLVTTGQDRRRDVTALSVNVNKIALLRNQRPLAIPSVVGLAGSPSRRGRTGSPCTRDPTSATSAPATSASSRQC
jgi:hypothetical protein